MDINKRIKQTSKDSMFIRGRRELGTPQGLTLAKTIALCAVFSITADIVGKRIGIKTDILYTILIVINVIVFGFIVIRMSIMSKRALERRRKEQQRKLEGKN